ncbi:MAG: hypothetical protein IJH14_04610 [Solobacterium sp.]|nr:hypothetical protein [Solobacterium sp.]
MTIEELSRGIEEGKWTCRDLVRKCLTAIAANDSAGRKLNSVAEINADVFFEADRIDAEIKEKGRRSPLHGVPVLLKDNIDIRNMHTTAGSLALSDLIAEEDAMVTKRLRDAGALILGKSNLSEFAYFMSRQDMPSGYSSRGGQVVHAYVPGVDPSGSSSGSAVAVSARFVPYAIGTETDGSLMSPAIANAIVSIKPTVGLVSRSGILPISNIQDTAGPMGTSVADCAYVLQAIAGKDEKDAATGRQIIRDYPAALNRDGKGLKVAVFFNNGSEREYEALRKASAILKEAGAEVVEAELEDAYLDESEALMHEFKQGLNLYLSNHSSACRSLADIIAYNRAHAGTCLVHGQDLLESSDAKSGRLLEKEYIERRLELQKVSEERLLGTLAEYGTDCLLSCGSRPCSNISPISGNPCLSLPACEGDAENWQACSYYLMAGPFREDVLLHTAYILEQHLQLHCCPEWAEEF